MQNPSLPPGQTSLNQTDMATFGYTTIGSSNTSLANAKSQGLLRNTYTASAGDMITNLNLYGNLNGAGSQSVDIGVYTFSGGVPVSLVGSVGTLTINSTTPQWWSTNVSINLSAGVTYTIAFGHLVLSPGFTGYFDAPGGNANSNEASAAGSSLPSTWTNQTTGTLLFSAYATYVNNPLAGFNIALV